jgi:hypothetical protein
VITRLLLGCIDRSPITEGHSSLRFAHRVILELSDLPDRRALADERPVPDPHGRYLAVVAEDTQGTRIQQKMLAAARGLPIQRAASTRSMSVRE